MKVIILAAGFGTRLKPITDTIPKCLVEVGGVPILKHWLDKLLLIKDIDEVIINTHYLEEKVRDFISVNSRSYPFKITEFYEPRLLGSAGTLWANKEKIASNDILVIYADNYSDIDLGMFKDQYSSEKQRFHIAVFRASHPEKCGIFSTDAQGNVTSFVEKPKEPTSDLANAGLYFFNGNTYLKNIDGSEFDIGFEVIPKFVPISKLYLIKGDHIDIGTHENLNIVNKIIASKSHDYIPNSIKN